MLTLQGLIFDLDGTLLDSASDIRQSINATLNLYGRRPLDLVEVKKMMGDGMMAMITRAFRSTGDALKPDLLDQTFNQFIDFYSHLKPDRDQLYPYVIETLEHYQHAGIKLSLCTNKQEMATRRLMDDLGLSAFFDFIAGGDTFKIRKPHAGHVRGVLDTLQIPAKSCVMIGDSLNDVLAAHGADVLCIAVAHGYGSTVEDLNPDTVISHFRELPLALKKLGFS